MDAAQARLTHFEPQLTSTCEIMEEVKTHNNNLANVTNSLICGIWSQFLARAIIHYKLMLVNVLDYAIIHYM